MKTLLLIMIMHSPFVSPVQNFVRMDCGGNSMGKTPTQIDDFTYYQKIYPDKEYVIFEGQDKWMQAHERGQFRVDWIIPKNSTTWAQQLQEYTEPTPGNKIYTHKNVVLGIDDITLALGPQTQKSFLGLFALRPSDKFNMCMFMNCHEPRNIPEGIKGYITEYHWYANEADHDQFKNKIPSCWKDAIRCSMIINEYERLYPGWYDAVNHLPYFPRIVQYKEEPTQAMKDLGLGRNNLVNMDFDKAKPIIEMFSKQAA